jgi:3-deoxy-D-manno-octulosonate 8-phosphate phosphatase (KDO 8-P phosphatase)
MRTFKLFFAKRRLSSAKDMWVFVFDVDGVLTDGCFYYSAAGKVMKRFGPHDSEAAAILATRFEIRFISADRRGFEITKKRISDMGFDVELVKAEERVSFINAIKDSERRVLFVADSPTDVPALRTADLSACPRNVFPVVSSSVDLVLDADCGKGVIAALLQLLDGN